MKWTQIEVDGPAGCKVFRCGMLTVFVADTASQEYQQNKCWHLSISHPMRYPNWNEIFAARYDLIPDEVTMAMLLPPRSEYVNIHNNCFHLHEIKVSE